MSLTLEQASVMQKALGDLQDLYAKALGVVNATGESKTNLAVAAKALDQLKGPLKQAVIDGTKPFSSWAGLAKAVYSQLVDMSPEELGGWAVADQLDSIKDAASNVLDQAGKAADYVRTALIAVAVIAGAIAIVYLVREARSFA